MGSQSNHKSSEYVDDDDSASNSSGEVEKPPVSLFAGEEEAVEAVKRLSIVLGSKMVEEKDVDGRPLLSPSSLCLPSLDVDRNRDDMFAALPDDCLAAVFRKLSNKDLANCALVCKWWFMVDALSRVSLSLRATEELSPQLPKLLTRFQGVHKLVLKCDRNMQSISDDSLSTIAQNCPRLRKFKLKNCKRITDVGMDTFSRLCPELRKFSCGGCGFGVAGLSSLLRNCSNLEDLTIKRSLRLSPVQVVQATVGEGQNNAANADVASTMTLTLADGGRIVVGIPALYDPAGAPPANGAGNRQAPHTVAFAGAGAGAAAGAAATRATIAGAAAAALGIGPPQGRAEGAHSTVPQLDIPETLNLRRLCLKDQNAAQLWVPLLEAARKVETLILARNLGSWDPVLGSSLGAGKMPELTQLYLERLSLTDRALRSVARCPKLEALVVVRTSECTDDGISAIAQGCSTLKRLHIEGWAPGHIGDRGLNSLAHNCRLLQELVLVGHSCTVSSMQPLATNCPGLERLTLCSSLSMSDTEMKVIAASCPNLRRLCVKACMRVTDVGIFALATGCPSLQKLKIRRCTGVSQSSLDYLQEQRPDLSITQESSAATAEAQRRQRAAAAAAEAEANAQAAQGAHGRIFEERDDAEFDARNLAQRRREHRDESPEVLRRFGSINALAGDAMGRGGRHGGARARFAQAATSIQRALRNWIGSVPPPPGGSAASATGGIPPHPPQPSVPGSSSQAVTLRPFSPMRERADPRPIRHLSPLRGAEARQSRHLSPLRGAEARQSRHQSPLRGLEARQNQQQSPLRVQGEGYPSRESREGMEGREARERRETREFP